MHASGSILRGICDEIRRLIDLSELDAKYDDNYLVSSVIPSATSNVMARVSMMNDASIVCRHEVTITSGTKYYQLPPTVRRVWRLAEVDTRDNVYRDWRPKGEFHPRGPGWRLEGNLLVIEPDWNFDTDRTMEVFYTPSGEAAMHVGCDGKLTESVATEGIDQLTTDLTPTLGTHDRRPNAFNGSVVRTNVGAGSRRAIEERIIHSHDWQTGVATLRTDLQYGVVGETIEYEVIPIWLNSVADAVAADAAMSVGTGLRVTQAHQEMLRVQYRKAVKTAQDTFGLMQGRMTKFFDDRNVDNSDREYAWAYKFTYGY
jgi:hypothetical protein